MAMTSPLIEQLQLDLTQLNDITNGLVERVREGLATDNQQIKALPAYLYAPDASTQGDAVVVDAGGTNIRAATVSIGQEHKIVSGPIETRLREEENLTKEKFFELQAQLVRDSKAQSGLPLGYCFSYPSKSEPDRDAILLRWTKGIQIPDVEGSRVGEALASAMTSLSIKPTTTTVLNDTVATLLGGSLDAQNPRYCIGLICGTGTNMATFYGPEQAPKLAAEGITKPMAINLESGAFDPPHLTDADKKLDELSTNPGLQRFEKAVSGYYLPFIFKHVLPNEAFDPALGSGQLVKLRDEGSGEAQLAAKAILDRAADLIAAGIAGVAKTLETSETVTVIAEGSLFWKDTAFAPRVQERLPQLLPNGPAVEIIRKSEVNLFGSAIAALS